MIATEVGEGVRRSAARRQLSLAVTAITTRQRGVCVGFIRQGSSRSSRCRKADYLYSMSN